MDMSATIGLIGIGLCINGAMLAYVVRVENRLTQIETKLTHIEQQ